MKLEIEIDRETAAILRVILRPVRDKITADEWAAEMLENTLNKIWQLYMEQ